MYKFNDTKEEIIDFIKSLNGFEKCFIVRNIFSRFAVYVVLPTNFILFEKSIKSKFNEWFDNIEQISAINDKFVFNDLLKTSSVVEGTNNVFFSERHVENTNWFIKDSLKLKTPITSFYSFKGGVGRTTATILTALLLARKGKKILLIDFDLEAPGLASVFANQLDNTENLLSVKGFVDYLVDFEANQKDADKLNIDDYYFVVNKQMLVGTNGGELIIVPAIATDSESAVSYIDKLSKANLKYGFGKDYIPDVFLKKIEEKIEPDFILIDTRTGINDVGGLVFNRYAQNVFLFFFGNQQNMFGLESILPKLQKLNDKEVKFYLVNSPVPLQATDRDAEISYYIEKSYDIFCKHFYQDNFPSLFDETADHYPINIPFNGEAVILNNYKKLAQLIEHSDSAYQEIADIIYNNTISIKVDSTIKISNTEILDCIIKIDNSGGGSAELEFKTEKDLTTYFYPRKDYKYIFDKNKFLILGEKGVGKSALFSVLSHNKYAKALANFCEVKNDEFENTQWIIGLDKDKEEFPSKENFEALHHFEISQLKNYWLILLLKQLRQYLPESALKAKIMNSPIKDIKHLAIIENIGEDLHELLMRVNAKLKTESNTLIVVYDHLDAVLSIENNVRGKLVSALLTFYYDNFNRLSNIKAKIFLRKDIFEREVNHITDKVKIRSYSVEIKWDYNQLLNVIWKRIYEQNNKLPLFEGLKNIETNQMLGSIPKFLDEKEHKYILDKIFGQNMGGNNKAYPYNWVRIHIEDTNNQIHPRTLIKLFSESAKLQKEEKEQPKDRIVRSKIIQETLKNVSKHQVEELAEEYPEFANVFKKLADKVANGRSPMGESDLIAALRDLGFDAPIDTISKLKEIGLLKDYKLYSKTQKDKEESRYHIPDLYLFGLNFTRKGTS